MAGYTDNTPYERIIGLAKWELGEEGNSTLDFIFGEWAKQGAMHLDNNATYNIFTKEIDVKCGKMKKPCGYIRLIIANINCCEYPFVDAAWFRACGCELPSNGIYGTVMDIGAYLDFATDYTGVGYLVFEGLNVDTDGQLMVDSMGERAIISYIKALYYGRKGRQFQQSRRDAEMAYAAQKGYLKGWHNKKQYEQDKHEIIAMFHGGMTYNQYKNYVKSRSVVAARYSNG